MGKIDNILLVEDNPSDAEIVGFVFKKIDSRANILAVGDGVEAMAFLHKQNGYHDAPRPDYILLDLNLPKKNGFEVLSEIRADQRFRTIPVVIMSCSEALEDRQRAEELGAKCFVSKTTDLDEFSERLKQVHYFWGSRQMRIRLMILKGFLSGKKIEVPIGKHIIGRADDSWIKPTNSRVSRHHCQLIFENDLFVVRDLESRNGTFVNGRRIKGELVLTTGDELRIGPLNFEVLITHSPGVKPSDKIEDAGGSSVINLDVLASEPQDMESDEYGSRSTDKIPKKDIREAEKEGILNKTYA